jgi:integrase/recombinase XerD
MNDRGMVLTGASEELVERYQGWLVAERSLAAATVKYYVWAARLFLSERGGRDLKSLTLGEVTSFVVDWCPRFSVGHAKNLVTGLRSLLGYLYVEGVTDRQLAPAVPPPAGWHGSNLPRGLGADVMAALLAGGDDATAVGRRDHAIVVLLARLGLRAGEVAALTLDDIDWTRGEIVVRGKGNRTEALPMPVDVGEAVVGYLHDGRPPAACRSLFLRSHAPTVGLSSSAIGAVVHRAGVRAGVPPVGAHRLRHSVATGMLRAGASLEEVGQVLRQRSTQVTALYARVDFAALGALALPWPGGVA